MGREAVAVVHWQGVVAEARVLLEATELVLRGAVRARIPRAAIAAISRTAEGVAMTACGEPLAIEMAGPLADRWLAALTRAPPGLAAKLGIGPGKPAFVLGDVDDPALTAALAGAMTGVLGEASAIVAVLGSQADLEAALNVAGEAPALPLWCVHARGAGAALGEAAIRSHLRAHGYVDSKTSGVSDRLTATRYGRRR